MPTYSAGSASVNIVPDFSNAQRRIGQWFAGMKDQKVDVHPEIDRSALTRMHAAIIAHKPKIDIDIDHVKVEHAVLGITEKLTGLGDTFAKTSAIFSTKVVALTNAGGALVAIAGAASQAAGALLLLPAGLAAIAAPIGAVTIGLMGVGDAFKALGDASEKSGAESAANAQKQAAAAQAVEAAQQRVQDAVDRVRSAEEGYARSQADVRRAQEDLNDARRQATQDLASLNQELAGAALNEEAAVLGVRRARKRLYEVIQSGVNVNSLERQEADLGYRQAIQSLEEIRRRNAELRQEVATANREGVEGSDRVTQARDRVTQAVASQRKSAQELTRAHADVKTAQQAVVEATKAYTAAMQASTPSSEKAAEAMAKLAPSARAFVTEVRALAPLWKTFQQSVQESLFRELGDSVQTLAKTALPALRGPMSDIAGSMGRLARETLNFLSSRQGMNDMRLIFDNIAKSTRNWADAAKPMTQVWLDITAVGSTYLPRLSEGLGDVARKTADWVHQARQSGQLNDIIDVALIRLKQLWDLLFQVGKALVTIFRAGADAGADLITMITQVFEGLNKILNSASGQSSLKNFFADIATGFKGLLPGIHDFLDGLVNGVLPVMGRLAAVFGPVIGDILTEFGHLFKQISPLLQVAAGAFGELFAAAAPLVHVFAEVAKVVLPPLVQIMKQLAPVLADVANQVGDFIVEAFKALSPVLAMAATAFGQIITAIKPLIPIILDLIRQLLPPFAELLKMIIPILVQVVQALAPVVAELLKSLAPALKFMANLVLWAFKEIIGPAIKFIVNNFVVPMLRLMGKEFRLLGELLNWVLEHWIKPTWDAIQKSLKFLWESVLKPTFSAIGKAFRALWESAKWVYDTILAPVIRVIRGAFEALWTGSLKPIWKAISSAWDSLMRGMKKVYDNVLHPIWTVFKKAIQGVQTAFEIVVKGISKAFNALKAIVANPINFVIENVFNDGLFAAWNWLVDKLHLPFGHAHFSQIQGSGITQFRAEGGDIHPVDRNGRVRGYYMGDNVDTVDAKLVPGEFVVRRSIAQKTKHFLEALNAGQAEAIQAAGGPGAIGPKMGFALGGNIPRAVKIAKSMTGTPYIWGGAGPSGADCSGFMSIITNALRDVNNPFFRLGTTATFPWANFRNGTSPDFTIGNSGFIGHMAGTLNGTNVESGSGHGPRYGGNSLGALSRPFNEHGFPNMLPPGAVGAGGGGEPWFMTLWHTLTGAKTWLFDHIKSIGDLAGKFGNSPLVQGLAKIPGKLAGGLWDWVRDKISGLFKSWLTVGQDFASGDVTGIQRSVMGAAALPSWGWGSAAQWSALKSLIQGESSWDPKAENPTSTASGLFQFIDGTWNDMKGSGVRATHAANATVSDQTQAGLRYIKSVYGSPINAYRIWSSRSPHWYSGGGPVLNRDQGGWLPPGISTVYNGTGDYEQVVNGRQAARVQAMLSGATGGAVIGQANFYNTDAREVVDELWHKVKVARRGGRYGGI